MPPTVSIRAIDGLVSLYCRLWDERRYGDWIELFAVDATFDWRGRVVRGRDAIQALIGAGNDARPAGPGLHVMSNTLIRVDDAVATSTSDFVFVAPGDGRPEIHYAGRTYDEFAIADGVDVHGARRAVPRRGPAGGLEPYRNPPLTVKVSPKQ